MYAREAGFLSLFEKVSRAGGALVATPTVLETAMVLAGKLNGDPRPFLMSSFKEMNITVIPFTSEHMNVAVEAFLRFGEGRHPARLNFGDCMSYAVASIARLPLLYLGTDFSQTDIQSA
jgi:ribonuclease VapC